MSTAGRLALPLLLATGAIAGAQEPLRPYAVEGDAIPASLTGQAGDAARGAALMGDRQKSLCILCHTGPFSDPHLQGTLAPTLSGIGGRLSPGQIRLRVVDMKALNPASIMPSYYRDDASGAGLVAAAWRGKPVLGAGEIEDIVAYLVTLKD